MSSPVSETAAEPLVAGAPAEPHERTGSVLTSLMRLHSRGEWVLIGLLVVLGVIVIPGLNLLPADSALHFPDYLIPLLGKFMCYALVALAVDLIWGYAGPFSAWGTACSLRWAAMPWACI